MIALEIIGRLLAITPAAFALVEGAAELAALPGNPIVTPAAYVWIDNEAAADNELVNAVRQRVEVDVSVLVIATDVSDRQGASAAAFIETLKASVRTALVGWEPPSAEDIITFGEAKIVRIRDGAVWCEMTFVTAYYLGD